MKEEILLSRGFSCKGFEEAVRQELVIRNDSMGRRPYLNYLNPPPGLFFIADDVDLYFAKGYVAISRRLGSNLMAVILKVRAGNFEVIKGKVWDVKNVGEIGDYAYLPIADFETFGGGQKVVAIERISAEGLDRLDCEVGILEGPRESFKFESYADLRMRYLPSGEELKNLRAVNWILNQGETRSRISRRLRLKPGSSIR